jgi:hypothetical protein
MNSVYTRQSEPKVNYISPLKSKNLTPSITPKTLKKPYL